jgi:hypothetical protein
MRKIFAIAVVTLLGSTAFAAGEVYRWKDANGVWHYSDQHQPGAELYRGQRPAAATTTPATAPAATPAPAAPPVASPDNGLPPLSSEATQEVLQEAAAAKAKACEKAKTDYNDMITRQRIYRTDEKGARIYLTAAEIDAARLQARSVRDLTCGP